MDRSIAAQFRHRLGSYALATTLSIGATIAPSLSEAGSLEERREAVETSDRMDEDHRGTMVRWFAAAEGEANAEPSFFQSWLADIYSKLLELKAAISSALPDAWKLGHGKSDNTCR
jgi:hypothetical protein